MMFQRFNNRMLYVVNHCMPYSSNGYAVRTHNIASGLVKNGLDVRVIAKPGFYTTSTAAEAVKSHLVIDGVSYIFPHVTERSSPEETDSALAEEYVRLINVFKPKTVMSASNWQLASPVQAACKATDTQFVYDVRGFWELSRAATNPTYVESGQFERDVIHEKRVATNADALITINPFMKQALVERGVEPDKISIVPNSMTPPEHVPEPECREGETPTIGYIGSFNSYEGLELLVHVIYHLKQNGHHFNLLLVGSAEPRGLLNGGCSARDSLMALAKELGVEDQCTINSRVEKGQVGQYFEKIDLIVIPRKKLDVTSLVSPLKPIEAAAYKTPMLLADLPPLQEYFDAGVAEKMVSYEPVDVANQIKELFRNREQLSVLADKAANWYNAHRTPVQVIKSFAEKLL